MEIKRWYVFERANRLNTRNLDLPLKTTSPTRFHFGYGSQRSDIFSPDVSDDARDRVMDVIARAGDHLFQVSTRYPERMLAYFSREKGASPLPNLLLGLVAHNQGSFDERWEWLKQVPARFRYAEFIPLSASINLRLALPCDRCKGSGIIWVGDDSDICRQCWMSQANGMLDWVRCGGTFRPVHVDWVRRLRDQCLDSRVPFEFTGWGSWLPCATPRTDAKPEDQLILSVRGGVTRNPTWGEGMDTRGGNWLYTRVGVEEAGDHLDCRQYHQYPGNYNSHKEVNDATDADGPVLKHQRAEA